MKEDRLSVHNHWNRVMGTWWCKHCPTGRYVWKCSRVKRVVVVFFSVLWNIELKLEHVFHINPYVFCLVKFMGIPFCLLWLNQIMRRAERHTLKSGLGFLLFFFNWSIVDLQCCVSFWCTAKWFRHTDSCSFALLFITGLRLSAGATIH